jgi:lysozyme
MKLDENGYKLIQGFEGLSLVPYLCSAKVATIGYGNTYYPSGIKVTMQDKPISLATANWMFRTIADRFAVDVDQLIKANLNQNQFNAITSLAYNIGIGSELPSRKGGFIKSTLLKKVNINPSDPTIAAEFAKWNKVSGKVVNGLTKRRAVESKLYFKI